MRSVRTAIPLVCCSAIALMLLATMPARAGLDDSADAPAASTPADKPATAAPIADEVVERAAVEADSWGALEILGTRVAPGQRADLHWTAGQSFDGSAVEPPVVVIRGTEPGPTLCMTAAIHGDELNGVEIVRRIFNELEADELRGTLIGAPIVNLLGFSRGSRYLPDRRDLNRYFPGSSSGSLASRIAHTFFNDVIRLCERLVDFHTGSFKRTNLPQLRADLSDAAVRAFVENFGATLVLHKAGGRGTLRGAATAAGIPAVTFELGEPGTLQLNHVKFGVKVLNTLLDNLDMVERFFQWSERQPILYRSRWLRAYRGGILTSSARVGARVREGELLGVVTNPVTNEVSEILSPFNGRLLGRALNQFVLPGFATFHIGIETDKIDTAPDPDAEGDELYDADDVVADELLEDQAPIEGSEARALETLRDDLEEDEVH